MTGTQAQTPTEKVFTTNFLFFLNVLRKIRRARHTLHLDTYIFELDRVGEKVLFELKAAAARGVQVRLTVDGFGSGDFLSKIRKQRLKNLHIRSYRLFPWPVGDRLTWASLRHWPGLIQIFRHMNRRNHKKVLLIDGQYAVLGSHNMSARSLVWREISVGLTDPAILADLVQVLEWSWHKCAGPLDRILPVPRKPRIISGRIFFSSTSGGSRLFVQELKRRLDSSETQIQIMTPYFAPPLSIVQRLNQAAKRGVRVEVIISEKTDILLFPRLSRVLYKTLLGAGVKIYEWPGVLLHAKAMVIDDWVVVGSSNMNPRSFFRDYEIDLNIKTQAARDKVIGEFAQIRSNSQEITLSGLPSSPLQNLMSYGLRRLLRAFL